MARETYYPTASGARVRHVCSRPGPKPLPAALRKINVTVRLYSEDLCRIERSAAAAGVTRQSWLEHSILDRLRIAGSSE